MRYRVEDLAGRAGVSVDTIRFYQGRGLLPAPEREGRVALYDDEHVERLARIRALKDRGFSLGTIALILRDELDEVDRALVGELTAAPDDELVPRAELAERLHIPVSLLEAIEREGFLVPQRSDGETLYSSADVRALSAGLRLLEAGLPLAELLALAREHDRSARAIADKAVEVFAEYVSAPIRAREIGEDAAAEKVVEAFRKMLPAVTELVAQHFRSVLLAAAQKRLGLADPADDVRSDASP